MCGLNKIITLNKYFEESEFENNNSIACDGAKVNIIFDMNFVWVFLSKLFYVITDMSIMTSKMYSFSNANNNLILIIQNESFPSKPTMGV